MGPQYIFIFSGIEEWSSPFLSLCSQAQCLCQRIEQHSDRTCRKHRPSLHYIVPNTGNLDSAFFVLAHCPIIDFQTQGFFKNLLEAWICLLLQALPQDLLLRYLSFGVKLFGITGFYIASHLHHCFADNDGEEDQANLGQVEFSPDPVIRRWFWQPRAKYARLIKQKTQKGYRRLFGQNQIPLIRASKFLVLRNFRFFIHHLIIRFREGDIILITFMLLEDTSHLQAYTLGCLETDSTAQLDIQIKPQTGGRPCILFLTDHSLWSKSY